MKIIDLKKKNAHDAFVSSAITSFLNYYESFGKDATLDVIDSIRETLLNIEK